DGAGGGAPPVHRGAGRHGRAPFRRGDRGHRQPPAAAGLPPGGRRAGGRGNPGGARMTADASSWRGVAAEKADEVSAGLAALLRERSRRLLGDLLRPHRRAVTATIALIVVESLAALAGPWLIGLAIDNGLPPLLHAPDAGP